MSTGWKRVALVLAHVANAAAVEVCRQLGHEGPNAPGSEEEPAQDGATVAALTWSPIFAKDVSVGDLIAVDAQRLDGDAGRGVRALRVTKRECSEHAVMFGGAVPVVTFLLLDVDAQEPASMVIDGRVALRVAVSAPDTVPDSLGGGA